LHDNEIIIGYIERLSPEKNLTTLLKSFTIVMRERKLVKLLLVGDGPQNNELREFTKRNGIHQGVIFCRARNDIRSILSAIDIFVLVSYTEGMPLALLEAMASGRAIICSDIPANRGLLSSDDALFVGPNDPESLARLIISLSSNKELSAKLAERVINKAECYDESVVFPKHLRTYKDLLVA
jgi:glycosyltransferase involved in cell wall biosynthesis